MCLAVPGKILSIQGEDLMRSGKISFSGVVKEVNLAYLPEAQIGDYAIIHAGVAIATVDPEEAEQTLRDLQRNMKYIDEYRDAKLAQEYAQAIAAITTRPWTLMEICGGQTHTIVKYGIDRLIPKEITLIHGPGCPVCVTPIQLIDRAIAIVPIQT